MVNSKKNINPNNRQKSNELSNPYEIVYYLLRCFALKYNTALIDFNVFNSFAIRNLKRLKDDKKNIQIFFEKIEKNSETELSLVLEHLCESDKCSLEYINEGISKINLPCYYIDAIHKAYIDIESDYNIPFPTEESLGITVPPKLLTVLNAKTDFIIALTDKQKNITTILKLLLPDGIKHILITTNLLNRKLLELAVKKIKLYMDNPRNISYIENKLVSIFKQKDIALKEMINSIARRPSFIVNSILKPNNFTFSFWAHFSNLIIQEFKKKDNMLPKEEGYCQAAYILSFYNVYFKEIVRKEQEKVSALSTLDIKLHSPPYAFTIIDIYHLRDKNGYPIIRKISKEIINNFLMEKSKIKENMILPELIRLSTIDGTEYYIHKSSLLSLCLNKILRASHELQKAYLKNWTTLLRLHKKKKIMFDDILFLEDIHIQLKTHFPLLYSLLNYELLYLTSKGSAESSKGSAESSKGSAEKKSEIKEINRLLDRKKQALIPFTDIFGLDRKQIFKEAKSTLPFWETIPFIGQIIKFLKRLFLGKSSSKTSEKEDILPLGIYDTSSLENIDSDTLIKTDKEGLSDNKETLNQINKSKIAFKKALAKLKNHLVGKNSSVEAKLKALSEKWNPLYDPVAKRNLVEDVNAFIRDNLRRYRQSFRFKPPDLARIRNIATSLSEYQSFNTIKHKEYFILYIEIYMIKILGERLKGLYR